MSMKNKKQMNQRLPSDIYEAAKLIRDETEFKADEIAEVAYATLFGSRDSLIVAKRKRIQEKLKELHLKLSFDNAPGQPPELELFAA
jgi:hypothetical protein